MAFNTKASTMTHTVKARPIPTLKESVGRDEAVAWFVSNFSPTNYHEEFHDGLQSAANQIAQEAVEDYQADLKPRINKAIDILLKQLGGG